jgi:hypothetical protein
MRKCLSHPDGCSGQSTRCVYDDDRILPKKGTPAPPVSPADLLAEMANTYRERNAVYGDNWKNVGNVMMAMFPEGVELKTADAVNSWHLWELIVVKLTRFANSKLTHQDSIHDVAVYAAMLEAIILEKKGG